VPTLVTGGIDKVELIDADKALEQLQQQGQTEKSDKAGKADKADAAAAAASTAQGTPSESKDDPMKGLLESMKKDQDNKKP
jgi:hypothetical protein